MVGDALATLMGLDAGSARCCVTSPPYWGLRDYGHEDQIGLEADPGTYVARLVDVFREVRRVLADDGTLWLNLGDCYATGAGKVGERPGGGEEGDRWREIGARTPPNRMPIAGLKPKDMVGIPWRVAFALQQDGWFLRSDVIWAKPNPMPSSVTDRPTKSHEYVFLLSKSRRYFYDAEAIKEPDGGAPSGNNFIRPERISMGGRGNVDHWEPGRGRNKRTVWTIPTRAYSGAHFAVMPPRLAELCILAGSALGDTVLDPFTGAGTVAVVAQQHGRDFIGCELNPDYADLARARIASEAGQSLLFTPAGEPAQ